MSKIATMHCKKKSGYSQKLTAKATRRVSYLEGATRLIYKKLHLKGIVPFSWHCLKYEEKSFIMLTSARIFTKITKITRTRLQEGILSYLIFKESYKKGNLP
jgi:hypothetical protein